MTMFLLLGLMSLLFIKVSIGENEALFKMEQCNLTCQAFDYITLSDLSVSVLHCASLSKIHKCVSYIYGKETKTCVCVYTDRSTSKDVTMVNDMVTKKSDKSTRCYECTSRMYQQTIGISIRTNCAPLLAVLFLNTYEAKFIQQLLSQGDQPFGKFFNYTFRYLVRSMTCDDVNYSWIPEFRSCVRVFTTKLRYHQAKSRCSDEGALLIMPSSPQRTLALNRFLSSNGYFSDYWIGVDDLEITKNYKWSNGLPVLCTNWEEGEPNSDNGACVRITYSENEDYYYWKDLDCTKKHGFICAKNVN